MVAIVMMMMMTIVLNLVQLTDNNGFWKQEFLYKKADTDIVTIICAVKVEMIHLHFNP